ncbi:MAG: glycosyltransferase [Lachnospiraceae bacterium]|nr:glycosyltransferase [Lachnospiraceae bacterium]
MIKECVILIPAYDPPDNLIQYIEDLMEAGYEDIIVVDDGSREDKQYIFDTLEDGGCHILHHEKNRGKGVAVRTGLFYYTGKYSGAKDGVITVNSDGNDRIEDIDLVGEILHRQKMEGTGHLVVGERDFDSPYISPVNVRANRFMAMVFRWIFGVKLRDVMCGFRGIPDICVTKCLEFPEKTYAYDLAELIGFAKDGYEKVPVTIPAPNPEAERHFRALKHTFLINVVLWRKLVFFGATSIIAAIVDIFLFWYLTTFVLKNVRYPIIVGTVLARIVSSSLNYYLSRKLVFKTNESKRKSFSQFFTLAAVQCCISAMSVHFLEMLIGGAAVPIKIVIDLLLFFVAYKIQDKFIFVPRKL